MAILKKFRFSFIFLTEVVKRQYKLVILGLFLGVLFFIIIPKFAKYIPQIRRTEKVGILGQYEVNGLPEQVLKNVSFGLTAISGKGEAVPALAENWEVNSDGKVYTFKISQSPKVWHDGKNFSINDINYNFKDVNFSIENDKVIFTLKEPFSPLPTVLSRPLFKKGLIGLGRYRVKKVIMSGKFVKSMFLVPYGISSIFTVNENSQLPNLLYRFYNSENEMKTAFNIGELNSMPDVFDTSGIALGQSIKINEYINNNAYLGIFLNTSRSPFQDKTFRQALAYVIPKETGEKRALGPINPTSWAYNPDVKPYEQDIKHAKGLFGTNKANLPKSPIKISTLPQYENIANMVKNSWDLMGIPSEVQISPYIPDDFDVLIIAREIPTDPDQYYYWHSTQAGNFTKFNSPRIDKLLEDGRKTYPKEERKNIYFDFQRYIIEETPVIFLAHPSSYSVTRD